MAGVNYGLYIDGINLLVGGESFTWYNRNVAPGKMRWFTAVPGIAFVPQNDGSLAGEPTNGGTDEWVEVTRVVHVWHPDTQRLEVRTTVYNPNGVGIVNLLNYTVYIAEQDTTFPLSSGFNL